MMTTGTILVQALGGGGGIMGFLPMILIIVIFYFFMIRPQMKKAKDHKKYLAELKVNDKVVTTAGIHGRITELGDTTVLLDVGSNVRIRFDKSAISLDASKAANSK
jgi:preprotein translocase subunit YajC